VLGNFVAAPGLCLPSVLSILKGCWVYCVVRHNHPHNFRELMGNAALDDRSI
jgi:hypothetical protein